MKDPRIDGRERRILARLTAANSAANPMGLNSTQWTRYQYMESQNLEVNSIAV